MRMREVGTAVFPACAFSIMDAESEGRMDMIGHIKMATSGGVFLGSASIAAAQSWGPRDLSELKQEAQRRAERKLPWRLNCSFTHGGKLKWQI